MATMMKEKRREKKKHKENTTSRSSTEQEQPSVMKESKETTDAESLPHNVFNIAEASVELSKQVPEASKQFEDTNIETQKLSVADTSSRIEKILHNVDRTVITDLTSSENIVKTDNKMSIPQNKLVEQIQKESLDVRSIGNTYQDLNSRLERVAIPELNPHFDLEEFANRLENPIAYMQLENKNVKEQTSGIEDNIQREVCQEVTESVVASAPALEEEESTQYYQQPVEIITEAPCKAKCMPLEEAIMQYGGKEMAAVRAMSEREEAIVEAGPMSGPEHPLVDLLSTFRSSLIAVERERNLLSKSYIDEEKFRNTLWKIEKRHVDVLEDCPCGATVELRATYQHAELLKERLPVAKLKLEGLLRDVQDSYCHHQHTALLTHFQIEELIAETVKSNKNVIREALALVLQALRLSDNAPSALATSLQRWAAVLSAALLDGRDLRQLLLLLHHLFRQTRSVRWAARVVRSYIRAGDRSETAQCIAVLDLLLSRLGLEPALECTEDANESWEEMDEKGGAGAVSEGALREQDLGALLHACPARQLVARLVLWTREEIDKAREHDWGDPSGGRGVLKSCCGVRAFLATLQRGKTSHPTYTRLHGELKTWAVKALHALAGLHLHTRDTYARDLEDKISAELEACFSSGFHLLGPGESHRLPATLLREDSAREYCTALIAGLHDKSVRPLSSLPLELPAVECGGRVRAATQAATDRLHDNDLARTLLDFLLQTGIKRKLVPCKGACEATARELLPLLLATHPYLHTISFHMLADLYQVEVLDPSSVDPLTPGTWRPTPGEVRQVLEDWEQRCPALLQHLLLGLDYTPHSGLSLQTQLIIGSWLCRWLKGDSKRTTAPEWAWSVLRHLRVHRSYWSGSYDPPPPDPTPDDLFSSAYAVLASSWGHCIPLICSEGVSALCLVAHARPADAVHCLGPVMLLMAHSPESVSLTPKFSELFSVLLKSGPTMVQRALGLGPLPGADLLLRLILHQVEGHTVVSRSSLVSAWLHALWRPCLSSGPLLDTLLLATREWQLFDGHSTQLLQDKNAMEHLTNAVRHVSTAPMLCECVLRNAHATREARSGLCARLLDVLHLQRIAGDRIHVDNALKHIGANMSSEDLVIYRTATALVSAPTSPPAHLTLWALFFYLYLQRPPTSMTDTTPPIGPLFFSGLLKSRVLAQLRRKLQESLTHHHNESEALKQNSRDDTPQPPPRTKHAKEQCLEDGVVPILTQKDLTGESSDSSDSDSEEESEQEDKTETSETSETKKKNDASLLKYHLAAESMFKELLRWLDEGDKTRAMPHHADIARFVPEQVLAAAWSRELQSRRPPLVEESSPPRAPPAPPPSPFQATMATLLSIKDCSRKRSRRFDIKSPLEDVDFKDARSLLSLVDKYLANIEALAEEWSTETTRISSLDSALWELVTALRVRRPLPPVKKQCPHKCKPLTIHIPQQEWCISSGAERGIQDNRRSANALVRRLARPRPHAARSAAALTAVARRVRSAECAVRLCERAWRCARAARHCAPAHSVLTAFVQAIADTWLCHDGKLCAELLARWGNSCSNSLQESLCGALVSPRRLNRSQWPCVYRALLPARLPPHTAFSYLSKFEMARWSESADPTQRRELLDALLAAAQRWGPRPDDEYHVFLELIGVHTATLINAQELCALIVRCARASAARTLPPAFWTPVIKAAHCHARDVPFDQLGRLLRELGVVWWEARSGLTGKLEDYSDYAPHTADLLHVLHRAFAAAAAALSYAPERVAFYSWSALQESWAPWICPHPSCPLLGRDAHADMLKHLVDSIQQIMLDCPGTEEKLLHQIFEWTVQTYLNGSKSSQECRIQLSTLLEEFRGLPWVEHQWFRASCLQHALQVCASKDQEIQTWCGNTWRGILAGTWLQGTTDEQLAPTLASLLYLFTSMTQGDQILEEATHLPWWRLPAPALEEALERFFLQNHSPAQAYHDLPAFRVLLFASELYASPACPPSAAYSAVSRLKRTTAVSRWVCAACAPTLIDHVPGHSRRILDILTQIAPYLERSEGEVEELLGRAVVIMCMEPAAAAAVPVWQKWVANTSSRTVGACVSAASVLTAFEYFASLADSAIRAHLTNKECDGWPAVFSRVHQSPWREAAPLCARARLHAAYAVLRTHAHTHDMTRTAVLALLAANVNFIENETIIAVWICTCCRIARECGDCGGEAGECRAGALGLLVRWGEEQRRSLLKLVTLQADSSAPTSQHRLLCRLAQCIISNSDATIRSYEAACTTVLGSNPDVLAWGRSPRPKHLPRLAVRLYPHAEKYFQDEMDLAPEDV